MNNGDNYVINNLLFYKRKENCDCNFARKVIVTLNDCEVFL